MFSRISDLKILKDVLYNFQPSPLYRIRANRAKELINLLDVVLRLINRTRHISSARNMAHCI